MSGRDNVPPGPAGHGQQTSMYGFQQAATWLAGQNDQRQLITKDAGTGPWRISVVGDVVVRLDYGTGPPMSLALDAPIEVCVPGALTVKAQPRVIPIAGTPVVASVTCTRSEGAYHAWARSLIDAQLVAVNLPASVGRLRALLACVVTVRGTAVPVAAGVAVEVVSGSVLTSGLAIVEHAL